jgi:hypothetical protein
MPNEESKKMSREQSPPVPQSEIGEHKCAEVDALPPTPERKAKTGEERYNRSN